MTQLLGCLLTAGFLGSVVFWVGCLAAKSRAQDADPPADGDGARTDAARDAAQRDGMRERLEALAKAPPPANLQPIGAMCYEPVIPADRAEYVCPICGERTVYGQALADWVRFDLAACRRLVGEVEGLNVRLDESQFCNHCSPGVQEPKLVLEVTYEGDAEATRVVGVTERELDLLVEFLSGSDRHTDAYDAETPLRDYADELAWVLGLAPGHMTREDAKARLEALAEGPAPTELGPAAMCYSPVALPDRAEYTCPLCGEKTIYGADRAGVVLWTLPACRRAAEIADDRLDLVLVESDFCRACSPDVTEPKLSLVISYDGADPHVVLDVSERDLELLAAFASDADRIDLGGGAGEVPLKDHIDRLSELLGVEAPATLTRAELQERLATLAESPPPAELNEMGAMCYRPAAPPDRAEYVCPVCGGRTVYGRDHAAFVEWETPACRRAAAEIRGVEATLDETALCERCRRGGGEPTLALVLRFEGGEERRIEGVTHEDLSLLLEFLDGEGVHTGAFGDESPLRDHTLRIALMLGLEPVAGAGGED